MNPKLARNLLVSLARFDLKTLCDKGILEKSGGEKGRGIKYVLKRKKRK